MFVLCNCVTGNPLKLLSNERVFAYHLTTQNLKKRFKGGEEQNMKKFRTHLETIRTLCWCVLHNQLTTLRWPKLT